MIEKGSKWLDEGRTYQLTKREQTKKDTNWWWTTRTKKTTPCISRMKSSTILGDQKLYKFKSGKAAWPYGFTQEAARAILNRSPKGTQYYQQLIKTWVKYEVIPRWTQRARTKSVSKHNKHGSRHNGWRKLTLMSIWKKENRKCHGSHGQETYNSKQHIELETRTIPRRLHEQQKQQPEVSS